MPNTIHSANIFKVHTWLLLCMLLVQTGIMEAQTSSDTLVLISDTTVLDSNSIIPESFVLEGLAEGQYTLDAAGGLLILNPEVSLPQTVMVSFKTFPFNFSKPFRHKDEGDIVARQRVYNPFRSDGSGPDNDEILNLGDIEKRGSISRGITVGNNQNLSVNSSLNLQLSGRLNDRFALVAAIADQNIPIQPDGNTQQLQDFDQVYIKVFDEFTTITAGDFQIRRADQGYFMQFNKRLQGARFETRVVNLGGDSSKVLSLDASGAVSRGKFARKTIQGVEGNQGPYRLTGADNEPFIVVLSGTERVYLDGRLLVRGQENDYIINYNTAEISFTPRVPITKDRRIVAEYQYADRNYARSMVYGAANYQDDRMQVDVAMYSEQDAKNQPLQQSLTDLQKDVLRGSGDSIGLAVASSIDSVAYSDKQLLYAMIDTLYYDTVLNMYIQEEDVLVYSTHPDSAHFQAVFSHVGEGRGNYVYLRQVAFGRIYAWVAPVNGVPQGSYEPVIQLVAPKQRQMVTGRMSYELSEKVLASVEWAGSNDDMNTFSSKDAGDNLGMGIKFDVDAEQALTGKWHGLGKVDYEFLQRNFREVERFRGVEFDRDWNLRGLEVRDDQNVIGLSAGARYGTLFKAIYGIKNFNAGKSFNGIQHSANVAADFKQLNGEHVSSYTRQEGQLINAGYYQHNTRLSVPLWKLQLGYKDDFEENRRYHPGSDSLTDLSFAWWEWEASVGTVDSAENGFKLSYAERTDRLKGKEDLTRATFARIYGFGLGLNKAENSAFNFSLNYRTLDIIDEGIAGLKPENTLISRTEYRLKLLKGTLTSSTYYEVGSGLENRKEFVYIETTPGQGTHIHIDYNGNDVKELDEFELAVQADQLASANFLKVFVPTSDYVKVFRNQFSQSLFIRPAAVWRSKSGIRKILSLFSDQFSYSADRKSLELPLIEQFNPFLFGLADSVVQSTNANLRNIFYFNQSHPVFGADLTIQRLEGRNLLTSGFESRATENMSVGLRWNFTSMLSLAARGEQGFKASSSDAGILSSRNFNINYREVEPRFVIQPGTRWRIGFVFNYKEQENTLNVEGSTTGGEKSFARKSGVELTLSSPEKGSFFATGNLISIGYSGLPGSAVGFEMLDGLQPGLNATWGVSYQRTLANDLQVNLNYNGRQSAGIRTIHTGGIEARAFF